LIDDFIPVN